MRFAGPCRHGGEQRSEAASSTGAYAQSQIEGYHKPFIRETGININSVDHNGGPAEIKEQVEAGNGTWDSVNVEKSEAAQGCNEYLFGK